MGLITVTGIVTRYANYRDSDRILTIFTDEAGIISASARGCRKTNSQLLASSELFVYGEFVLFKNKDKYTINACDIRESFYPLREDMDRFSAAMFMLELINHGSNTGEGAHAHVQQLYYALSYTAYADVHPLDMAICFAIRYLASLGFCPALTYCVKCGADLRASSTIIFDVAAGGAVCDGCAGMGIRVSATAMEALRRMMMLSDQETRRVKLPERVRLELKTIIKKYADFVLECELKAIDQL
ncbi:MAG: DNA repair protein RecO [Clostridia bacterium]